MQQGCQESHLLQTGEAGHLYRQMLDFRSLPCRPVLKSLRWGLPQSPVIASRAVRLCMSSGHFAVTGRNKKSEARLCRNVPVLPCLFSSVLVYFLLPLLRGLPLFFHLLAVEHFHILPCLQKFLHLLLCFPVVPVCRLFL